MVRFYISMVLIGFLFPTASQGQSLLSTAGGFYRNSTISVSWSLGESITETFGNQTHTLTQGFQQSKLGPVGVIEPKEPLTGAIEVFPNPTQGLVFVIINPGKISQGDVPDRYVLYDIRGKLLEQEKLPQGNLELNLAPYSGAVYYLRLFNPESNIQETVIIQRIK
jgi:hypothetical protein